MAKTYSMDLRERVLKDCDTGMRSEDVAAKYTVSASWVYDLRKKRRETGSIAPKQQRHGSKPKLAPYEKEVRQLVADHPDATLAEFCEMLSPHVSVSTATLCDFLRHLKITRKKRLSSLPNGTEKKWSPGEPNGSNSTRLTDREHTAWWSLLMSAPAGLVPCPILPPVLRQCLRSGEFDTETNVESLHHQEEFCFLS